MGISQRLCRRLNQLVNGNHKRFNCKVYPMDEEDTTTQRIQSQVLPSVYQNEVRSQQLTPQCPQLAKAKSKPKIFRRLKGLLPRNWFRRKSVTPSLAETFTAQPQESFIVQPQETFIIQPKETFVVQPKETFVVQPQETFVVQPQETFVDQPKETFVVQPQETFVVQPQETFTTQRDGTFVLPPKTNDPKSCETIVVQRRPTIEDPKRKKKTKKIYWKKDEITGQLVRLYFHWNKPLRPPIKRTWHMRISDLLDKFLPDPPELKRNECWDKIEPSWWPYLPVRRRKARKLKTADISEPVEMQISRVQRKVQNKVPRRTIFEIFEIDDSWCEGNFLTGEDFEDSGEYSDTKSEEATPSPLFWWEELGHKGGGDQKRTISKGSRLQQKSKQDQFLEALRQA